MNMCFVLQLSSFTTSTSIASSEVLLLPLVFNNVWLDQVFKLVDF